jgi:hypothetical protein
MSRLNRRRHPAAGGFPIATRTTPVEDHPPYPTGPDPAPDPDSTSGPTTDERVALARAHREGEAYPTPEELRRNLPRLLRAISDFVLADEADVIHTYRLCHCLPDRGGRTGPGYPDRGITGGCPLTSP